MEVTPWELYCVSQDLPEHQLALLIGIARELREGNKDEEHKLVQSDRDYN